MICDQTTLWGFATQLALVATNTTLGTATRHDFAAITIHTPEAPSGNFTIKSAMLVVTARDAFTVATNFTGLRIGIKLGAVAFDDVDYTYSLANTADHETLIQQRDVTAYFQTNYGTGATQTCQVGVAVATSAASNVNNITCELFLTYDYDNAAATHAKTAEIPLQGDLNTVSSAYSAELGTAGASAAPANQIPQLTGAGSPFLPEAGVTIRQCYARFVGLDGGNAATDFNLTLKIDAGGADMNRATLKQALQSSATFRDLVDLIAAGMDTTTAHGLFLKVSGGPASAFDNISVVLVVTYTHTTGGTRELHSLRVPLEQDRSGLASQNFSSTAADDDRYAATLRIAEPGAITMLQSGAWIFDQRQGTSNLTLYAPGQAERTFANRATATTGTGAVIRRGDHDSSTWALARGINRLSINLRSATLIVSQFSGFALVNYTSNVSSGGYGAGNRSVAYAIADHQTEAVTHLVTQLRTPSIPSSPWRLACSPSVVYGPRAAISTTTGHMGAERATGEDCGDGWYAAPYALTARSEATRSEVVLPCDWFKRASYAPGSAASLVTSRRFRSEINVSHSWFAHMWITHSTQRFTVAGTITINGGPAADGKSVKIFAKDSEGVIEEIATVTTSGGTGAFTANVPDDVRTYWASYADGTDLGRSADGTPSSSTFNVTMGGGAPRPLGSRIVRRLA